MSNQTRNERVVRDMKKLLAKIPKNAIIPDKENATPDVWIDWFLDFFLGKTTFTVIGKEENVNVRK